MHARALLFALTVLPALAWAEPCGGISYASGTVTVARPLPLSEKLEGDAAECVGAIAKGLAARPGLRTVTVAVRLPDGERLDGNGMRIANAYAMAMVGGGVSASSISPVAPAANPGDAGSVQIAFTEKRSSQPVALAESASGDVKSGPAVEQLGPLAGGAMLPAQTVVRTGSDGRVALGLADGSRLRLPANSMIVLRRLYLNEDLRRVVEVDLKEGRIEARVAPGGEGSTFDVNTRAGVAGVRGTEFAVSLEGDAPDAEQNDLRIETIEGLVALERDGEEDVEIPAGTTAGVSSSGALLPPSKLVVAPEVTEPLFGEFDPKGRLKWKKVDGNDGYVVEIARDAEFTLAVQELPQRATSQVLPELGQGKWFWRVTAMDDTGHRGVPSKVYAFVLPKQ